MNQKAKFTRWFDVSSIALLLLLATSPASASVVAGSTCLPPNATNDAYLGMYHQWVVNGVPYVLSNPSHSQFTNCTASPTSVGGTSTDIFSSTITGTLSVGGSLVGPVTDTASVMVSVTESSATGGGDGTPGGESFFSTQMTQLNINLGGGMEIRIDPTNPSTGQTTITNQGNGTFLITSFFDVFTDLSLDGGNTWTPSL